MKCELCEKEFEGFGNNALPYDDAICCDECNNNIVLPLRLYLAGMIQDQILVINATTNKLEYIKIIGKEVELEQLQNLVEGYIELFPLKHKYLLFIVNEEGLLYNMPYNELAKRILGIDVVGNLVICPKKLFK